MSWDQIAYQRGRAEGLRDLARMTSDEHQAEDVDIKSLVQRWSTVTAAHPEWNIS